MQKSNNVVRAASKWIRSSTSSYIAYIVSFVGAVFVLYFRVSGAFTSVTTSTLPHQLLLFRTCSSLPPIPSRSRPTHDTDARSFFMASFNRHIGYFADRSMYEEVWVGEWACLQIIRHPLRLFRFPDFPACVSGRGCRGSGGVDCDTERFLNGKYSPKNTSIYARTRVPHRTEQCEIERADRPRWKQCKF